MKYPIPRQLPIKDIDPITIIAICMFIAMLLFIVYTIIWYFGGEK